MSQADDKTGARFREASRLRATLGSEPSGGYAFHDKEIVDRIRPARELGAAAPQIASHAPGERSFARTLAGGVTLQEMLAAHAAQPLPQPKVDNDQAALSGSSRKSWPPIPPELIAAAEPEKLPSVVTLTRPQEPPPAARGSSAPPVGGAIWQAMPSLVDSVAPSSGQPDSSSSLGRPSSPSLEEAKPAAQVLGAARPPEAQSLAKIAIKAQPAAAALPQRPSAADLEAERAKSYGDARLLRFEKLVERGAWEQLLEEMKSEQAPSPALSLLALVARRETLKDNEKGASAELSAQAIQTVAHMLELPHDSPTALVLAKRLLRKNPAWTRTQRAGTGLSLALLAGGLSVGAGIGWLVTRLLF